MADPGRPSGDPELLVSGPDLIGYRAGLVLQRGLLEARIAGLAPDMLLLCEHEPTITLGRGANFGNLLVDQEELGERGVGLHHVERGGDVTWHGPGQLVGYPVVDLGSRGRDVHRYLRDLEEILIRVLAAYDLRGVRETGLTGVWVDGAKIAAIGIKVRRWVTMHGFALNIHCDLGGFRDIVPCGLRGRPVTSMERLLGPRCPSLPEVAERLMESAREILARTIRRATLGELEELARQFQEPGVEDEVCLRRDRPPVG